MPGPASTSSNTRPSSTMPGQRPAINTQTKVLDTVQGRLLCIADIRGNLAHLNTLAAEANAKAIIHTGDFGFIDAASLDRISDRSLSSCGRTNTSYPHSICASSALYHLLPPV
ncbi:hypothetical protein FRC19_005226 [Serendipita sp. 401]|nr:hypothetical protein FRC19_005226 [Serendipita sp. 401]